MLRPLLLHLSHAAWARSLVVRLPPAKKAARRFIAGETLDDAIAAIQRLNPQGIDATLDHLGENVTNAAEARRAADACLSALERIEASGGRSNVSIKLTQFGLDIGAEVCAGNVRRLLQRARELGSFVRVDMESSANTDRTLELVRAFRQREGFEDLGAVIQAYLYRSRADLCALAEAGIPVRLCKGAYDEPPEIAFPRKQDVDANFIRLTRLLLDRAAEMPAPPPADGRIPPLAAIATHDPRMIEAAKDHAAQTGIPRDRFEFQMLNGIRRELQQRLAAEGYRVRVYVPYGTQWYPYFMRRLAERPANLWFFVLAYFRE